MSITTRSEDSRVPTKVPRRDEPVASLVPGPATYEHARVLLLAVHGSERLRARQAGQFHQLQA